MGKKLREQTWEDYGISNKRYKELMDCCQSGAYDEEVKYCAEMAYEDISMYIIESVKKRKTYESVEYFKGCRIPCGRTDFYAYRRLFYHLLDERLKMVQHGSDNIAQ